jgi:arginyl-tRNA synthetase
VRAREYLEQHLKAVLSEMGMPWPDKTVIEPPKDKRFGDLATNVAMVLAGQTRSNPRELAVRLSQALLSHGPEIASPEIISVDVAGPGFLNITFSPDFWRRTVSEVQDAGARYGASNMGAGKKVNVEYVSANPTGPLHIGHGRGAAIGDSLTRILRFMGYEVGTEYYLNDAGRQMRLLGQSVLARLREIQGGDGTFPPFPEDGYKGEYIKEIAQEAIVAMGEKASEMGEDETVEFCRIFATDSILKGIRHDLEEFRVEHQKWFSESTLLDSGAVEQTFDHLKEKKLAWEEDGAFWFKSTDFGDDKDRVLRKSDGYLTYFASDIAYHENKFARGFDLAVDIWGADHHGYIPRVKAAVQALGKDPEDFQVILVQLVNLLRGGEQIAMSTRAGQFETLADVCAEVGVDAARFIFLSRKSDSPLDFDLELVKRRTMDNPVYYVQYAHARICSVLRKAVEQDIPVPEPGTPAPARLDTPEDLNLLKALEQFPDVLQSAVRTLSPHHVSYYVVELAGLLHRYYSVNSVLAAPDAETVQARLILLMAVARVLDTGLDLLGVTAPERM